MTWLALSLVAADLLLTNGTIWTGNPKQRLTNAVAIEGKRIVAIGPEAAKRKAKQTIDLGGRFVMPGFNDAHIHFLGGSTRLSRVDLTGICTLEEIQRTVYNYAKSHPEATWILGGGWEYMCFPNNRLPTKEDLDQVVADRPVYLSAYDGHTAWANSKALAIGEVTRGTVFNGFGEIVRDAKGDPTGALKEGAMSLVGRHVPRPTRAQRLAALEEGMKLAASLGITSFQNANGDDEEISLYEELERAGKLTLRVSLAMSSGAKTNFAELAQLRQKYQTEHFAIRAVKFLIDGVIESHTAALLEPYSDGTDGTGPTSMPEADFARAVLAADKAGFQIYTHAIGDRGVRLALDAYEKARQANGARDARHRIEHIEVIHPSDVPRFRALGVLPVMQPIHADPGTVEVWSKAVGAERVKMAFAWKAFLNAGARLTFSSDWPACISLNPIRGLHNAVNRQTTTGHPPGGWQPQHRVSVEEALTAYTRSAAYASFEEERKGQLAPGMLADLIVLDRNPLRIPARELHTLRVEKTIFDGRVVYEKK